MKRVWWVLLGISTALLAANVVLEIIVQRMLKTNAAEIAHLQTLYPPKCQNGMKIEPGQSCMIIITIPKPTDSPAGGI